MSKITLGHIEFSAFAFTGWVFTDLTDWWGLTDDKVPVTERSQGHGSFSVEKALRISRAVSFNAAYLSSDQSSVEAAYDELAAVGAEGPVTMAVETPSGASSRTVTVRVSKAADHKAGGTGVVAVDCIARDPRRYASGAWQETPPPSDGGGLVWPVVWPAVWAGGGGSGRITLTNSGRAPSSPVFRLVGGFASAVVTTVETGARVGFDRPVPSGSFVDIDVARRSAVIDGQSDVSRWLRFREWEDVPALSSRRYQLGVTGASGSPLLRGKVDSAWW